MKKTITLTFQEAVDIIKDSDSTWDADEFKILPEFPPLPGISGKVTDDKSCLVNHLGKPLKFNITINNKQVEAEINEEELRAALGESEEFKLHDKYSYVNELNQVISSWWTHGLVDISRLIAHNAFKTEAKAYAKKMRQESIESRLEFVPQEGEGVWFWSYQSDVPYSMIFKKSHIPDWNIGAVKRTKEECEAWAVKYAQYFKLPR